MPTLLPALNDHMRRLARREIRAQTQRTKKASAQHRRDIAALKRLIKTLVSRLALVEKRAGKSAAAPLASADASADGLRFRRDGFKTHRAKLGLSAKDYGKLIGVSGLTVYHWEQGKAKPRRKQLPAIAAVRGLGKREALQRLGDL
ncbi:MAG TPA: helix-turn-helix domain-containing protein [Phycisphaerae bacterium]|jgi:DNA-binding transcriptional regulator YiaG|nr:helix-turn-helix domain-containing protein [Phycisphaerae bacterium]